MLPAILEAAPDLSPDQALGGEALKKLWALLSALHPANTVETGAGASTAIFSQLSRRHWAFTNDGDCAERLTASPLVRDASVRFVLGPSQRTLAAAELPDRLDAVLLDGPHAYPLPQLEYWRLYPRLASGGLLVLDDLQIPTVHELYRFLLRERMFELERRVGRTAFFRRTDAPTFAPDGDSWDRQGRNRRRLRRYSWTPRLLVGRLLNRFRATGARVWIDAPVEPVGAQGVMRGRVALPAENDLWVLARREGQGGWWPQGGDAIVPAGDGRWSVAVKFGEPWDAGARFEVLAVVVGEMTTGRWRDWHRAGDGRPVQLPPGEYLAAKRTRVVSRRVET